MISVIVDYATLYSLRGLSTSIDVIDTISLSELTVDVNGISCKIFFNNLVIWRVVRFFFFFLNDTPPPDISPFPLPPPLPIPKKKFLPRRQFLHRTAGAAGALAASPAIFLEPEHIPLPLQSTAPSDRLRFGIIGIGMQGSGLLTNAIQLPGVECVAACDLYDGRHTLAQEIVGKKIPTTRRYKELLENKEIDCSIAPVPDHSHKQVQVDAVSAGKDIYCEKPMSHSPADGVAMVAAAKKTGRVVQIGSQRVSSVICAKAKELLANGIVGTLTLVEGSLGRNDPTGAWVYPPPPDLSLSNFEWDTWQGDATKRPWDPDMSPKYFARWRCWKEYGTGLAADLLVHLVSGMNFMLGWNEPPKRAMALGDILRFKDGRNMPDVHCTLFDYGRAPVYLRLNLGCDTPEIYRFQR